MNILIRKLDPAEPEALSMLETMDSLFGAIRDRAFDLFQERGKATGRELDDWLRAERELLRVPPAELVEEANQYHIRLEVPGFEPNQVEVTAMPDSIVVQAEAKDQKDTKTVRFSEFAAKKLFRHFEMPEPIDPQLVKATLAKGILELTAPKATPAKQTKIAVQGA